LAGPSRLTLAASSGAARRLAPTLANRPGPDDVAVVRLLLILGLGAIAVALVLALVTGDRRYLRFVVRVAQLLVLAIVVVIAWFLFDHLTAGRR
jgi:hypothetical protein